MTYGAPSEQGPNIGESYAKLAAACGDLLAAQAFQHQLHPDIQAVLYPDRPTTTFVHRHTYTQAPEVVAIDAIYIGRELSMYAATGYEPIVREPHGLSWARSQVYDELSNPVMPIWWYGNDPVYGPGQPGFNASEWYEGPLAATEAQDLSVHIGDAIRALTPAPVAEQPKLNKSLVKRMLGRLGIRRYQ